MVEVGDLLAEDEIFHEGAATLAGFERVVIVVDGDALVRAEIGVGAAFDIAFEIVDFGGGFAVVCLRGALAMMIAAKCVA